MKKKKKKNLKENLIKIGDVRGVKRKKVGEEKYPGTKVEREQFRRRGYQMRHSRCRGRNDASREWLSIAGKKRLNWPAFPSLWQR